MTPTEKWNKITQLVNELGLSIEEDNYGQAIIYTDLIVNGDTVRDMTEDDTLIA